MTKMTIFIFPLHMFAIRSPFPYPDSLKTDMDGELPKRFIFILHCPPIFLAEKDRVVYCHISRPRATSFYVPQGHRHVVLLYPAKGRA